MCVLVFVVSIQLYRYNRNRFCVIYTNCQQAIANYFLICKQLQLQGVTDFCGCGLPLLERDMAHTTTRVRARILAPAIISASVLIIVKVPSHSSKNAKAILKMTMEKVG
jgi:hypothetical protein